MFWQDYFTPKKIRFKGTVSVILIDPSCKDGSPDFTKDFYICFKTFNPKNSGGGSESIYSLVASQPPPHPSHRKRPYCKGKGLQCMSIVEFFKPRSLKIRPLTFLVLVLVRFEKNVKKRSEKYNKYVKTWETFLNLFFIVRNLISRYIA